MKRAFITGVTGQDGAYLSEYLLEKGYEVHGLKRRTSSFNTQRIDHLYYDLHNKKNNFFLHHGDLGDASNLTRLLKEIKPNEVYNLAAQSHVAVSFEIPEYTANSDALGVLRLLEALRLLGMEKDTKFYQASTSELYGKVQAIPQDEMTPFYPRSPYGVAKLYAYWITKNYREAFGMFASNGILFNHESPIRGETFVTRKITRAVARIKLGIEDCMYVGNLNAERDWGHAKDYVRGMWMILQHDKADDFVLSTGKKISVRNFIEKAFKYIDIEIVWEKEGINEIGINKENNQALVRIDERYFRPTEVDLLVGDSSKAKEQLGWEPEYDIDMLIEDMVSSDLVKAKKHG